MRGTRAFTVTILVAILFLAIVSGASASQSSRKIPAIFDTDICDDIDDTWALAFLLQCPELDVKLITTELGDSESQVKIVAKMLAIAGRTDIPIGRGMPYRSEQGHNQDCWIEDYNLSSYPGTIYADGVQAIINTIMNSPELIP